MNGTENAMADAILNDVPPDGARLILNLCDELLDQGFESAPIQGYYSNGLFHTMENRKIHPAFVKSWTLFVGENAWPAGVTNAGKPLLPIGPDLNSEPEPSLVDLIAALSVQTQAITRLANSCAMLAQAVMEQQDLDQEESSTYMDGKPKTQGKG